MAGTSYLPDWDRDNQRFSAPSRCPYPDCEAAVDPVHATEPTLAWCAVCHRPYEVVPFRPAAEAAPLELNRRPNSANCTYTGRPLTSYSVLDWCEAGGEPGRSYCLEDARGAVFGPPEERRIVRLAEDWIQHSILSSRGDDDFVSSVSVVRGWVVAVTARGWVGLLDAGSGEPAPSRPLEWPTGSTHPLEPLRSVRHAPAFRGTGVVLAAPHEAQFRALGTFLFSSRDNAQRAYRMVSAEQGRQFLGPPLGIDGPEDPVFCLLEGRENGDTGVIEEAWLRFFDEAGNEISRCPAPGIARPPIFDRHLDRILWIDCNGGLASLASRQIRPGQTLLAAIDLPDPILEVEVNLRPTFAVAQDAQGRSEVWLSTALPDGGVDFHRTVLGGRPETRSTAWRWQTQTLSGIGQVTGFAVGIGSMHRYNAASQLIGVATDRQVLALDRANLTGGGRLPMTGPESVGTAGSFDVPLLCSAGVIARLQSSICIEPQGLGWSDASAQPKAPIPGLYQMTQGMAMFGRRVYIGHGMGVRSYVVEIEEVQ
ncbi:MAG: hypothetical protein M3O15_01305 [Acidobacteriota bacterium]|nr:hypothetical protein [Acidobacteriota bacterium]